MRARKLVTDHTIRDFNVPMAFLIDSTLAPHICLRQDMEDEDVPADIQDLVDNGNFAAESAAVPHNKALETNGYYNLDVAAVSLYRLHLSDSVYVEEFVGSVSELDDNCAEQFNHFSLLYIPAPQGVSVDSFEHEVKCAFRQVIATIPNDFPWRKHIVSIKGKGCGM